MKKKMGFQAFFLNGAYTFGMSEVAEEDCTDTIELALQCNNEGYSSWAMNMRAV